MYIILLLPRYVVHHFLYSFRGWYAASSKRPGMRVTSVVGLLSHVRATFGCRRWSSGMQPGYVLRLSAYLLIAC